jgi:hypothetical protein
MSPRIPSGSHLPTTYATNLSAGPPHGSDSIRHGIDNFKLSNIIRYLRGLTVSLIISEAHLRNEGTVKLRESLLVAIAKVFWQAQLGLHVK